jgi:hypothetical protein
MRSLLLLAVLVSVLSAETLDAVYAISYGIFPPIGTTTLHFESEKGRYRIVAEAKLHGLVAVLARHHTERHTSIGHVDARGRLVPERYETLRTLDGYRRERRYFFDRQHHHILFEERIERTIEEKHFDPKTMHYLRTKRPETTRFERIEPYNADNDLLSLYFNARPSLAQLPANGTIRLAAAGAGRGIVRIVREKLPLHYILFLDQDIFQSKKGELHIETDEAFYVKNAVLKDVLLFGDLKVERVRLKERP